MLVVGGLDHIGGDHQQTVGGYTNSLFVNRKSPEDGVQENHANTFRGNLTFSHA